MLNTNLNLTISRILSGGGGGGGGFDPDAQAFIDATGISGAEADSINTLTVGLKSAGLWTDLKVLYPFVGTTSTQQKYNLKDPRDLDAAFRLTFAGGWTHDANGAKGNGTNGYADMHFDPGTDLTDTRSLYLGLYLYQWQVSGSSGDIWGSTGVPQYRTSFWGAGPPTNTYWVTGQNGQFVGSFGYGVALGNYSMNRANTGAFSLNENNYPFLSGTDPYTTPGTTYDWLIGGYSANGTPAGFTDAGFRAVTVIDRNLTDTEEAELQSLLDQYYGGRPYTVANSAVNWYYAFDSGALLTNGGLYGAAGDLTNVGSVGQGTGKFGDAAEFNGTGYFTGDSDIGQQPFSTSTEWTICGWVSLATTDNQVFTTQRTAGTNGYRILMRPSSNDILLTVSGTNLVYSIPTGILTDGDFHHLAITMISGGTFELYIDGTSYGTGYKPPVSNGVTTMKIGYDPVIPGGQITSGGKIDDLMILRERALTQQEILGLVYSKYPYKN